MIVKIAVVRYARGSYAYYITHLCHADLRGLPV